MTTSVPAIQFTPTGLVVPTDAEILAGVQIDINNAFGGDVNPALETPQGQLASSEAAVVADKNAQIALIANQVDPDFADGRWQDAIGRIYFISRIPAQGTVVTAQVTGAQGTVIPVGAQARDVNGYIYTCTSGGTIDVTGTISVVFTNTTTGPIACGAGTLTTIYQRIPGWDSITNASAGVLGRDVESRVEFEARRQASVALNSKGTVQAIQANLLQVSGVLSVYVYDNASTAPIVQKGVTIPAHSIYVGVEGGVDADVANAIWQRKDGGCGYTPTTTGTDTTVVVYDTDGYTVPYPQYSVTFTRPAALPIFFDIQIRASTRLPININTLIEDAIIAAGAGSDGGPSIQIAGDVYASRYYSPVALTDPNVEILSIKVGTTTPGAVDYVTVNADQIATISAANITITQV